MLLIKIEAWQQAFGEVRNHIFSFSYKHFKIFLQMVAWLYRQIYEK